MNDDARGNSEAQPDATIRATTEPVEGNATRPTRQGFKRPWMSLALVVLCAAVVFFPALRSPFISDDYLHASMIDGTFPGKRGIFDLYDFINDADRAVLAERGMITWWADPELEIRFFRPLASALRWGEHLVLGRNTLLLHLHSFAWWFAAVLAARALFLRALGSRAAFIATFIFALAPCHVMPLAWLANREVFMSLAFGTFALNAYVRYRDERAWRHGLLAFVLFALALFSGEYALSFAGFVLAFEVGFGAKGAEGDPKPQMFNQGLRRESITRRAVGLLPFVVPTVVYMATRAALDYGSRGSGYYTDPLRDPIRFLTVAPRRFVTLSANAWMSLDYESLDSTASPWLLVALFVVGTPVVVVAMRSVLAALDDARRRWFWFFAIGSLLAVIPVMAVSPSPRVLGTSMLGVAPLVAMLLDHVWFVSEPRRNDRGAAVQITGFAAIMLGFAHLVHAPGASWLSARRIRSHGEDFIKNAEALREQIGTPSNTEVIVVRGVVNAFYMPFVLDPFGRLPVRWRILSQTSHALVLRRGPRTLDIIVRPNDRVYSSGPDHLFRQDHSTWAVGNVATMPGVRMTILAVGTAGPRIVRYEFDRDLESPTFTWLAENSDGFSVEKPLGIGFGKPYDL
ncbi:MAG: hypothetical protein IPM54_43415 [Polyangiaceae bacterium]|nr:hypothetical protein [Polyangiaceae bacterium]